MNCAVLIKFSDKIWEHIREPRASPVAAKTGARFFFNVGGFTKEKKKLVVNITNNGDMIARLGTLVGSHVLLTDHVLNEQEEESLYQAALKSTSFVGTGMETPVGMGRLTDVEFPAMTDAQYEGIINGTMYFYVTIVASFKDELTPPNKVNFASTCARFHKNTDAGLACISHIESRSQN